METKKKGHGLIKVSKNIAAAIVGRVIRNYEDFKYENFERDYFYTCCEEIGGTRENYEISFNNGVKFGIDIGASEIMLLLAFLRIINDNKYLSNCDNPTEYISSENPYFYNDKSIKIRLKVSELLKLYGLNSLKGQGKAKVLKNLKTLSCKVFVFYYKKFKDKEKLIVLGCSSIFNEINYISLMGSKYVELDFMPPFYDQIDKYFFWIPSDFIDRLVKLNQKGNKKIKISKHELILFIFIFSQLSIKRQKNRELIIKTNFLKLAYQLRMYADIKRKNWKVIRQKVSQYIDDAINLGYILKAELKEVDGTVTTKELNHDQNLKSFSNNRIDGITLYLNLHSVFHEENK